MMQEQGVFVDHATAQRYTLKILPILALVFCKRKGAVVNRPGYQGGPLGKVRLQWLPDWLIADSNFLQLLQGECIRWI